LVHGSLAGIQFDVADNLELVRGVVGFKLARLRLATAAIPRHRRGSKLRALMNHLLNRVDKELEALAQEEAQAVGVDALHDVVTRKYERLSPQLDSLHEILAAFRDAVGRSDVPVGLQHLIDVLMETVVIDQGDPIVQLSAVNMYSTIDLVAWVDDLFSRTGSPPAAYSGNHPIAFNLPALDPQNALLAPILAHEVGHTAVNQSLLRALEVAIDPAPVEALLAMQLSIAGLHPSGAEAGEWVASFQAWCAELICDAIAIAVTGPSFVLAFCAFAPPSASAQVGTHPSERDRIRIQLKQLDERGWTPTMERDFPSLTAWLRDASNNMTLTGTAKETFLRGAIALIENEIIAVAEQHIASGFDPKSADASISAAADWLSHGVPAVEFEGEVLGPWAIVMAGWIATFREHGDDPASLASGVGDTAFNAVVVKALEMSSIVTAWRAHERSAS